jgi:hypothetical protein
MAAAIAVPTACNGGDGGGGGGDDVVDPTCGDEWDCELETRQYDYNAALRIAALRLTGDLPSLTEINEISATTDLAVQKTLYEARLREYIERPTFARQMFYFWRDTFRMGDTAELDTAPALAAQLSATNGSYMSLLTQATGNCPSFDETTSVFTPGECPGTGPQAGVLGNPAAMRHFFGNYAFRRVKWVQETFDCVKFPVEMGGPGEEVGAASPYVGEWPFTSISGLANGGRVDFLDVSAVICAHCHQTLNHIAPLFANYDEQGVYQPNIAVPTPLDGAPLAVLTDYYPAGETTAWRYNQPVADIPALGQAMAADPDVAKCGVARIWNWALGKTDIVDTLQEVPLEVIQGQVDQFVANGFKMKDLVIAVYSSDDFTKF